MVSANLRRTSKGLKETLSERNLGNLAVIAVSTAGGLMAADFVGDAAVGAARLNRETTKGAMVSGGSKLAVVAMLAMAAAAVDNELFDAVAMYSAVGMLTSVVLYDVTGFADAAGA